MFGQATGPQAPAAVQSPHATSDKATTIAAAIRTLQHLIDIRCDLSRGTSILARQSATLAVEGDFEVRRELLVGLRDGVGLGGLGSGPGAAAWP